ncbi:uncharacterized protein MEPE_00950 [Melanopsichium pennsylvanicum]|uniref:Bromo domain-containing protein n=2 Tax=Melanopsichium pennsylvanicum TaxID=63383 RepID=A0AAJ5C3A3_9BASI|nr:bromodomain containing protein [Melanopsichium pennsylvanicum 4]SNX82244.1 uncharacterized protein MEPE_00950 [Melanopsichium pennsylvanicum]
MNPIIPSPATLQPSALARLTLRDKLLLAQAVHEIGTTPPDWGRVSALLLSHPLIRAATSRIPPSSGITLGRIFGTRECERAWTALMRQRGLVLGKDEAPPLPPTPSGENAPSGSTPTRPKEPRGLQPRTDRRSQLALAQLLYAERMEELKEQIKEKEEQFRSLVKEIDEIKSGAADGRLEVELRVEMEALANGPPLPPSTPATPASTNASTTPKSSAKKMGTIRPRGESSADKAKKAADRRTSVDDTPSKVLPGSVAALPTTSVVLPKPATQATAAMAAAPCQPSSGDQKNGGSMTTEEAEAAVATAATEAAVKALQDTQTATPASTAAVLQADVDRAAEKVVETETNLELSAQAEGSSTATNSSSATTIAEKATVPEGQRETAEAAEGSANTKPVEAPPAEVVVKEKESLPATPTAEITKAAAPTTIGTSAAADSAAAGANKRKREEEESTPQPSREDSTTKEAEAGKESPVKKVRTTGPAAAFTAVDKMASSDDFEMDSEDEAAAAVGIDEAAPSGTGKSSVEEAGPKASVETAAAAEAKAGEEKKGAGEEAKEQKEDPEKNAGETAMDQDESEGESESSSEEEAVDEVKNVASPSKRAPAKDEGEPAEPKDASDAVEKPEEPSVESIAGAIKQEDNNLENESEQHSDEEEDTRKSRPTPSRSTTLRNRPTATTTNTSTLSDRDRRKTAQVLSMLLTEVSNHTHGNLFHAPIKEADAPDYYTLIKQPLDIKTIKARIKEGSISSAKQLRRSLSLMFANSLIYNRPGTEVHRMANEMFAASEEIFKRYEGTQRF